jgi:hypothetical protein
VEYLKFKEEFKEFWEGMKGPEGWVEGPAEFRAW